MPSKLHNESGDLPPFGKYTVYYSYLGIPWERVYEEFRLIDCCTAAVGSPVSRVKLGFGESIYLQARTALLGWRIHEESTWAGVELSNRYGCDVQVMLTKKFVLINNLPDLLLRGRLLVSQISCLSTNYYCVRMQCEYYLR